MLEFLEYYKINKNILNKELNEFNNKIKREENKLIKENIDYFTNLNCDGKLIRGSLVNLGYKLNSNNNLEYSNKLALAFEVFQTAILVHDDIIDNDDLRRGKKTIHKNNYDKYIKVSNDLESNKISKSLAICMGDLGLFYSNKIIIDNYINDKRLGSILSYFNDIVIKTIKGEILDVILPFNEKYLSNNLYDNIMKIYEFKTAYYTIIGPMCLGLKLSGANNKKINDITRLGLPIGIAFQMQDDYLGIFSTTIDAGKNIGSDIKEMKQTILYEYTKENKKYYNELLKVYGKNLKSDSLNKVRDIFIKSNARDYTLNKINELFNESFNILDSIDWINKEDKKIIEGFILYLKNRSK